MFDRHRLPAQLEGVFKVALYGIDGEQSGACRVDGDDHSALWSLNTHLSVLRQDLCDVAHGVTDLPSRSRRCAHYEPSGSADLLLVEHSDGQTAQ